jgi:hypothetical protein
MTNLSTLLKKSRELHRQQIEIEHQIAELTGNERKITARFMRCDNFEYEPKFKLIFVGNHKPKLTAVDDAIALAHSNAASQLPGFCGEHCVCN